MFERFFAFFKKDIMPIVLAAAKSAVIILASTQMSGTEKKLAAMNAVKITMIKQGLSVATEVIDDAIEGCVKELNGN